MTLIFIKLLFMYIFLYMAGEIESGMKLKIDFYCECLQAEEWRKSGQETRRLGGVQDF